MFCGKCVLCYVSIILIVLVFMLYMYGVGPNKTNLSSQLVIVVHVASQER